MVTTFLRKQHESAPIPLHVWQNSFSSEDNSFTGRFSVAVGVIEGGRVYSLRFYKGFMVFAIAEAPSGN
jgi:hypothetical protein